MYKIAKIKEYINKRIKFQQTCIKNEYRLQGKPEEEIIAEYKQLLHFIDKIETESKNEFTFGLI